MIQAIVFLPLIGAILAGLISIFGAHARNPSGDVVEHHDDAHGHAAAAHDDHAADDHGHDDHHAVEPAAAGQAPPSAGISGVTNAEAIGRVLYTDYIYFFQAAGIALLIAMIGAIVLTLRHRPGVRRQNIAAQVGRTRKTGMDVVSVKPGEGIPE